MFSRERHLIPWIASAAVAVPVLAVRYPPMTDLPLHEGAIALLRHFADPRFAPTTIYALNLGHSAQLFHLLGAALAIALPVSVATKVLVAAALVGIVTGTARLATHLGSSVSACIAAVPVALGWTFISGFAPNLLGLALFLHALPAIDRAAAAPSMRGVLATAGVLVILFFAHATALAMGAAAVGVFALVRVRARDRRSLLALAPLGVVPVLLLGELAVRPRDVTPFAARWAKTSWQALSEKAAHVDDQLLGGTDSVASFGLRVAVVLLIAFAVWRARERLVGTLRLPLATRLPTARFAILAGVFFVAYVVLPDAINFGVLLYARFLAPAFVVAIVVLAPRADDVRGGRFFGALATLACVALAVTEMPLFVAADANARDLDSLSPMIEDGTATAELALSPTPDAWRFLASIGERTLPVHGGRALHSLTEYPNAPVVMRNAARWDATLGRVYFYPADFAPAIDLRRFSYALVFADPSLAPLITRALAPEGERVGQAGCWLLFRSRVPVSRVDAPEGAVTVVGADTLQARISEIEDKLRRGP